MMTYWHAVDLPRVRQLQEEINRLVPHILTYPGNMLGYVGIDRWFGQIAGAAVTLTSGYDTAQQP